MKVDASAAADMNRIADQARRLESLGYDGLRLAELDHDPFMPLALAAELAALFTNALGARRVLIWRT